MEDDSDAFYTDPIVRLAAGLLDPDHHTPEFTVMAADIIRRGSTMATPMWLVSRVLPVAASPCSMAVGGKLCPTCHGRGGWDKDQVRWEPCNRCGGKGGKQSGKVYVSCSGCSGAGGRNRNTVTFVSCGSCGGTGRK